MPIEDSILPLEYGSPKEARYVWHAKVNSCNILLINPRFFQKALHMGYPAANGSVYPWMESVMAD
jgi:hypothetical protein